MNWLMARLAEPSTWRGIVALIAAAGFQLDPEQIVTIATAAATIVGVINVVRSERKE